MVKTLLPSLSLLCIPSTVYQYIVWDARVTRSGVQVLFDSLISVVHATWLVNVGN